MCSNKEHFRQHDRCCGIYERELGSFCSFLIKIDLFLFRNTAAITPFNTFIQIEAPMAPVTQIQQIIYAFESTGSHLNMHQKILKVKHGAAG